MPRRFVRLSATAACLALSVETAAAQAPPADFTRGPGFYLAWWKLALLTVVLIAWVATTDWANIDAQRRRQNYILWNPILVAVFLGGFLAALFIPIFWVGLPLMTLSWLVPLFVYIRVRNASAEDHEKVMTSSHLRYLASIWLRPLGIKISAERKTADEQGPAIKLIAQGAANETENQANLVVARQSPGYLWTRELLSEAFQRKANSVMFDFTADAVGVRYEIDGVWHNSDPRDRESGDAILAVIKTISALNANERRARQEGTFQTQVVGEKAKTTCRLISQGVKTGERAILKLDDGAAPFKTMSDIGVREKMQEQILELLARPEGMLLFSAPPEAGLSTTMNVMLSSADRFVRSFAVVEDVDKRHRDIENVPVTTFDAKAGETPMTVLPKLVRLYPDVITMRELTDGETATFLCDQATQQREILCGIRAKDAAEALLRVLMLKVAPQAFAPVVVAVMNQRLVRKLCETCREPYEPPPKVLQQLGIPAGKVEAFYRPPEAPEEVCRDCGGIGYRGRTGIFELLMVDDTIRELLVKSPKTDLLRAAARKGGMRSLQQEGLLLVLKGVTSLAELMRVLS